MIINNNFSERIGGKHFDTNQREYKFAKIKKAKDIVKKQHPNIPIIDMGIGEPDLAADEKIVEVISREAGKPENRWYADNGIAAFQEAASNYLNVVYGVNNIDPEKELLHGIGGKSILSLLPLCFINPGDITLTTIPGYPVLGTHTKFLGGQIYELPLHKENNYYPNLLDIPKKVLRRAKLLYINYPNNPTGQVANVDFYNRVVEFADRYNIVVISDAAYGALTYDGYEPLSFLSVDGAKDVGVEVHSLSKPFNMTGWRLGFVAGNEKIIKAYGKVKAHTDSGQFIGIQKAGIYALNNLEITKENCERYSRRFDLLINALKEIGFKADKPKATFYCYVPIPKGANDIQFKNAEDASTYILENALISTVPWDNAGAYLRFSVTFEADTIEKEKEIINELKERLLKLNLIF